MDVIWLGHSCFRLRGRVATVLFDPYTGAVGGHALGRQSADILCLSNSHPNHSNRAVVEGSPPILRGPGEYEIKGVFVTGVWSFADDKQGKARGRNTIFLFHLGDLVVCHLGALGHTLTSKQVEAIGDVDVLLVPVGGGSTLTPTRASEVISQVEPKIVVPMHYSTGRETVQLGPLEAFTKEMGLKEWTPQDKLAARTADLDETTKIVVLEAKTGS